MTLDTIGSYPAPWSWRLAYFQSSAECARRKCEKM